MSRLPAGENGFFFVSSIPVMALQDFFTIHFVLGMDGLNAPLLLLTSLVALAAAGVVPGDIRREREFFVMMLLIVFGATGAFASLDLFFFYIFHEVALIPTFLMIGIWGTRDRKLAATQMTLYLTLGSLVLLVGLLAFYFILPEAYRTFDLRLIKENMGLILFNGSQQAGIFLFLLLGFGALVSLVPLHSWAPLGYAAAPAPVAMLHAGVLKKFGIYGLLRIATPFLPEGIEHWSLLLQLLLLGNILYIGWVTLAQRDLDFMIGYSSVMHMGYLFLGLISMSLIGGVGVVVLMVGHGLSTALLFALTGEIRQRTGTVKMDELGGLAQKAPRLTFLFIIGGLASIGLPGLANFSGEIMIFFGAWNAYPVTTGLALFGVVLSAVYMLRAIRSIFFGEISPAVERAEDLLPTVGRWPFWILATGLIVFGIFPKWITQLAEPVIRLMLGG